MSTLHVIHHGIMPLSVWFGVKFTPGGHSTFFGLLNTFVHIVMYSYYLLAALGPQMQRFLWWKKYLTTLQMVSNKPFFAYKKNQTFLGKSTFLNGKNFNLQNLSKANNTVFLEIWHGCKKRLFKIIFGMNSYSDSLENF